MSSSEIFRDVIAGVLAAVVLIANIVSFGALMFPGRPWPPAFPTAIWAMLVGSSIGGIWIALATSLPPLATGIDSPTGAVLVLLSASAASQRLRLRWQCANRGCDRDADFRSRHHPFSGALLHGLGALRWGSYFRFVPYFVVGGFLAATGWFLDCRQPSG